MYHDDLWSQETPNCGSGEGNHLGQHAEHSQVCKCEFILDLRKFKKGDCPSHHFVVTHGQRILFFFLCRQYLSCVKSDLTHKLKWSYCLTIIGCNFVSNDVASNIDIIQWTLVYLFILAHLMTSR